MQPLDPCPFAVSDLFNVPPSQPSLSVITASEPSGQVIVGQAPAGVMRADDVTQDEPGVLPPVYDFQPVLADVEYASECEFLPFVIAVSVVPGVALEEFLLVDMSVFLDVPS